MLSYYLIGTFPAQGRWQLSTGRGGVMPIANLRFDEGSWFHKNRLMSFDIEAASARVQTVIYHPNAKKLAEWLDKGAHAAMDFVVCAMYAKQVGTNARIGRMKAIMNEPQGFEQSVKNAYRIVSGTKVAHEGGNILYEFASELTNPKVFGDEGYYGGDTLLYPSAIHRDDVYYGPCPPPIWPGSKMS